MRENITSYTNVYQFKDYFRNVIIIVENSTISIYLNFKMITIGQIKFKLIMTFIN